MKKSSRIKIKILLLCFLMLTLLPVLAKAGTIDDMLVGSSIQNNDPDLRQEMYLYKANDGDPNYDYYLVEFHLWEERYDGDIYTEIWFIDVYFDFYASFGSVVALQTYREPDPGILLWETPFTLTYYGAGLDIWLPAGSHSFEYVGSEGHCHWHTDAAMGGWGTVPATRSEATYTIGFRVSQDAHVTVYGNARVLWYRWFFFWLQYVRTGWGTTCYIYY